MAPETLNNAVADLLTKEIHGKDFVLRGEKAVSVANFHLEGPEYTKRCYTTIGHFRKAI